MQIVVKDNGLNAVEITIGCRKDEFPNVMAVMTGLQAKFGGDAERDAPALPTQRVPGLADFPTGGAKPAQQTDR